MLAMAMGSWSATEDGAAQKQQAAAVSRFGSGLHSH
jgi:hypothetical protein